MKSLIAILTLAAAAAASAQNTLVISPATGDFGSVAVGKLSPAISFKVTNNTISTMGYLGYANFGEFKLYAGNCHLVNGEPMLNPGQSCTFSAFFKPTMAGPTSGDLSIQTSSGTFNIPMSGMGVILNESTFSFCGYEPCTSGALPAAGLIQDSAGNLYGTTSYGGGSNSSGTVFKLDNTGHETVLYNFCSQASCSDGAHPYAGVIQDAAGTLYGTTRDAVLMGVARCSNWTIQATIPFYTTSALSPTVGTDLIRMPE